MITENHRQTQTARGIEAVQMLADFLEKHAGVLNVSVFEKGYSVGVHHCPDLVFRQYGVEVKRIELLCRTRIKGSESSRLALNNLKIYTASWAGIKCHCVDLKLIPVLIAVVTFGKQPPIFVGFTADQIDEMERIYQHRHSPHGGGVARESLGYWFGVNSFAVLREGTILNIPENFNRFFAF